MKLNNNNKQSGAQAAPNVRRKPYFQYCSSISTVCCLVVIVGGVSAHSEASSKSSSFYTSSAGSAYERPNSSPEALDLIKARGFVGERYMITSQDGYSISIYHIINPLANQATLNRYPAVILHGIGGDASQMIARSQKSRPRKPVLNEITHDQGDECLAFMLSNNNFDVFVVDARGSNLNDHKAYVDFDLKEGGKFWNFTLDEQAQNDVPALVDFVLEQTGAEKLHYIGYSETTFFMFAHLSMNPSFESKLASFVAMAPVAYLAHFTGLAQPLSNLLALYPDQSSFNFYPQLWMDTMGVALKQLCSQKFTSQALCSPVASTVAGWGGRADLVGFFATIFRGTSIRAFKHFMQLHNQKRFGMYDYGWQGNMRRYGQPRPPNYPLNRIKMVNLILVRGGNDYLSDVKDQQTLLSELGTRPLLDIFLPRYNHFDFLVSDTLLFDANIPIAKTILRLTREQAAPLTAAREPGEPMSPRAKFNPRHPVGVSVPDGNKIGLIPASHLLKNVIGGALVTQMDAVGGGNSGLLNRIAAPLERIDLVRNSLLGAKLSPMSLGRLEGLGSKLDGVGGSLGGIPYSLLQPLGI